MAATQSNEQYWLHRQIANEAKAVNDTEFKLRELGRHYRKAIKSIDQEVKAFYKKHAGADGKIDMAQASVYVKSNLTRLDALKQRVQKQLGSVIVQESQIAKRTLSDRYQDGYYKSSYELQRFKANYRDVDRLSPAHVDRAISTAWSGRSYSARIWGRHQRLTAAVDEILTQGVLLGHSNDRMARLLAERMNVSYSNAKRLVRTESNYVYNQGTLQAYQAGGIVAYEFVATLDMRTSDICQSHDGKQYKITEAQVGRNYPPMHPNCRSTTVPVFADDDELDVGERFARDADGKPIRVRGNMTYPEWQETYLVDQPDALLSSEPVFHITGGTKQNQNTVQAVQAELELLPESHKVIAQRAVNEVMIVAEGTSRYDRQAGKLYVLEDPVPGEVIHELGHAIETELQLFDQPAFIALLRQAVGSKTIMDVQYDPDSFAQPIWLIESDKLVSEYQGRMYQDAELLDDDDKLNPLALREFFSEAYRVYLLEPEKLKEKHAELYQFIKELLE